MVQPLRSGRKLRELCWQLNQLLLNCPAQIGKFWGSAKQRFSRRPTQLKLEPVELVTKAVGGPAKVAGGLVEVARQPVSPVGTPAGPVGAPVQVNVYANSDSSKGVKPGNQVVEGKLNSLPNKSLDELAKGVEKIVNSMLKNHVTYLGLLAATVEIGGPNHKGTF